MKDAGRRLKAGIIACLDACGNAGHGAGRAYEQHAYFLLLCFYGCFALGALYWTLYLLLFDTTPRVFYVSEFGWVASLIFLRILQATLTSQDERSFRCRRAWLAPD